MSKPRPGKLTIALLLAALPAMAEQPALKLECSADELSAAAGCTLSDGRVSFTLQARRGE